MLKVSVKIPDASLKAIKKAVEAKLMKVVEEVSLKTYNYILTHDYPYHSGSYISSWNINVSSPDRSFNAPAEPNKYPAPTVKLDLNLSNPYQKVYLTNYAPHSYQVEVIGTPTHPNDGWYIAAEARYNTLLSYRFF